MSNVHIPQEGRQCWAVEVAGYPLPGGLENRSRVKILKEEADKFLVEDPRGGRWTLFLVQLDAGHLYHLNGEYHFETHPVAVHSLRNTLLEIEQTIRTAADHDVWAWIERKDRVRWYLERNGFDPDAPIRAADPSKSPARAPILRHASP